jgi:hypothetical protein
MRIVSTLFVLAALATLAGCGSDPAAPTHVTAEEERQLQEDQKKVDAEEQQHQAGQRTPEGLSPEKPVEMQERARPSR